MSSQTSQKQMANPSHLHIHQFLALATRRIFPPFLLSQVCAARKLIGFALLHLRTPTNSECKRRGATAPRREGRGSKIL